MITIQPKASLIHFPYIGFGQNARDQSRGSNSNAGKVDQIWSKFNASISNIPQIKDNSLEKWLLYFFITVSKY